MSSEKPRLTLPNSCIMSSLLLDENSMNSIGSQRAGSATVSGKKIPFQDSLFTCKENTHQKFPIPAQTLNRISKQNTQVKKFLHKKSIKPLNNQPASPRIKSKLIRYEEVAEKPRENSVIKINALQACYAKDESPRGGHTDTPGIKTHEKVKNNSKKGGKSRTNLGIEKKLKKEIQHQIKFDIEKLNLNLNLNLKSKSKSSKVLAYEEKMITPRSCNTKSKKSIGLKKHKKDTKEFIEENDSEAKSNEKSKKKPIEFSKIFKTLGTDYPKMRPLPNSTDSADRILNKRSYDSIPKLFARERKRKHTQQKLKRIENIFMDNKSKISLESIRKAKSKDDLLHRIHKLRLIPKKLSLNKLKKSEDQEKFYKELHSSRDKFFKSNDQQNKCEISQKKKIIGKRHIDPTEKSAIMIQSHIRKYLAQKKYKTNKDSFSLEDAEVKNIVSILKNNASVSKNRELSMSETTAKNTSKDTKMSSLKKLKMDEINEIRNIMEHCDENTSIFDTISKIIDNRYKNIEKIIQAKYEFEESQLMIITRDKNILKDNSMKNWCGLDENEINTKSNSETSNKVESENSTKEANSLQEHIRDGLAHQILSYIPVELKEIPSSNLLVIADEFNEKSDPAVLRRENQKVFSEDISSLSETVLKLLLGEELEKYHKEHYTPKIPAPVIQEKCTLIIDLALNFISRRFDKIYSSLTKPLRKNPLEILAKIQRPYIVNPLRWDYSQFPSLIPTDTLNEFNLSIENSDSKYLKSQIKVVMDSCNQVLQSFRPYGTAGFPMPWAFPCNRMSLRRYKSKEVCEKLKQRIHCMNSMCSGKVPDNSYITSVELDEGDLQSHREEKIVALIAHSIREDEQAWIDYELEETQTKLNTADDIFQWLIAEVVSILQV